ncbi:MAG: diguanylate cyclase [Actinomycetota bacterium]|nr:diguanylate cyclase [Actinomycetota bacterium]
MRRGRPRGRGAVLRPAQACLGRLRYSGKFLVIALVLLIPLASAASTSLRESREAKAVLERELRGVEFIEPVMRVAVGMYADREKAAEGDYPPKAAGPAIDELDDLAASHGATIGVANDWRAAELALEPVQWPAIPALPDSATYDDAALALQAFAKQIADSSGLTLDTELQSHYLADALLVDVPQVLAATASVHEAVRLPRGHGRLVEREVRAASGLELEQAAGRLADNLHRATAAAEGRHAELVLHGSEVEQESLHIVQWVRDVAETSIGRDGTLAPQVFDELRIAPVRNAVDKFVAAGVADLQGFLVSREQVVTADTRNYVGFNVLALLGAAYLFVAMARATSRDLATVRADLARIADGDLTSRPPLLSAQDELADIARAVSATRNRLAELVEQIGTQAERFRSLVHSSSDLTLVTDADAVVLYASPSIEALVGCAAGSWEGESLGRLAMPDPAHRDDIPDDGGPIGRALRAVLAEPERTATVEFSVVHADGAIRTFESTCRNLLHDDNVRGIIWNTRDVSERVALQERLQYQALHDVLTGLPNRLLFTNRLDNEMRRRERTLRPGVLLLDLDGFKQINDGLGHATGDAVLVEVARRFSAQVRPSDTVARLGGDEFAVIVEGAAGYASLARDVAERLLASLAEPFHYGDVALPLRASVGVAVAGPDVLDADDLVRHADEVMYVAKRGRLGFAVHGELHD